MNSGFTGRPLNHLGNRSIIDGQCFNQPKLREPKYPMGIEPMISDPNLVLACRVELPCSGFNRMPHHVGLTSETFTVSCPILGRVQAYATPAWPS